MTLPLNPADTQVANPSAKPARQPSPQGQRWQQELARAQGQTTQAQTRNTLPAFDRPAAPASTPHTLLRQPPQPQPALTAQAASDRPAAAQSGDGRLAAHAIEAHAARATPTAWAGGFLRAPWVSKPQPGQPGPEGFDPLADQAGDQAAPPHPANEHPAATCEEALCEAIVQQAGAGQGHLGARATLAPEGLDIILMASGPLARDLDGLRTATLAFFARHGLHVARLECNGQLIYDGTRGTDRLDALSGKD